MRRDGPAACCVGGAEPDADQPAARAVREGGDAVARLRQERDGLPAASTAPLPTLVSRLGVAVAVEFDPLIPARIAPDEAIEVAIAPEPVLALLGSRLYSELTVMFPALLVTVPPAMKAWMTGVIVAMVTEPPAPMPAAYAAPLAMAVAVAPSCAFTLMSLATVDRAAAQRRLHRRILAGSCPTMTVELAPAPAPRSCAGRGRGRTGYALGAHRVHAQGVGGRDDAVHVRPGGILAAAFVRLTPTASTPPAAAIVWTATVWPAMDWTRIAPPLVRTAPVPT